MHLKQKGTNIFARCSPPPDVFVFFDDITQYFTFKIALFPKNTQETKKTSFYKQFFFPFRSHNFFLWEGRGDEVKKTDFFHIFLFVYYLKIRECFLLIFAYQLLVGIFLIWWGGILGIFCFAQKNVGNFLNDNRKIVFFIIFLFFLY